MLVKRGIAVSPGVAIGPALVLGAESFRIPRRFVSIDAVDMESARFRAALEATCKEIEINEKLASERLGAQYGAIFSAHLMMARDPKVTTEIEALIREKSFSPEFAVGRVLGQYAKRFQNLGDQYFAERSVDIYDLEKRLLRHLLGERREELTHLTEPVVLLAHNLTPSETAGLDKQFVLGFATELGGHTSHTAILAGALQLPAVVGIGSYLSDVSGGETIIIDGSHGVVVIEPDQETLDRLEAAAVDPGIRAELDADHAFAQAVSKLNRGDLGAAETELLAFAGEHPRHTAADNALYLAGLIREHNGDCAGAVALFERVPLTYPAGDAVLSSLVEKGRCLTRMQRKDEARELFAKIVREHPEGVEGGAARQLLMNLDIESGRH